MSLRHHTTPWERLALRVPIVRGRVERRVRRRLVGQVEQILIAEANRRAWAQWWLEFGPRVRLITESLAGLGRTVAQATDEAHAFARALRQASKPQ